MRACSRLYSADLIATCSTGARANQRDLGGTPGVDLGEGVELDHGNLFYSAYIIAILDPIITSENGF